MIRQDNLDCPEELDTAVYKISEEEFFLVIEDHDEGNNSWLDKAVSILEKVYRIISSELILPDRLKNHTYSGPLSILTFALIVALPVKVYLIMIIIGFALGLFLAVPLDHPKGVLHSAMEQKYEAIKAQDIQGDAAEQSLPKSGPLSSSPLISARLERLLDRLVMSVIDPWFMEINKSGQREFQSCIRSTIDSALLNLRGILSGMDKDSLTLLVYGLTNALNVHMQEFKAFTKTKSSYARDFLSSTESRREFLPSTSAEAQHLRQLISTVLKKLLPRQESRSIVVMALLKEVLASGVLWNAMDRLCEPDFINMKLVEALQERTAIMVEPGWSVVVVKIIKGQFDDNTAQFYCVIHIAGRKVKTHKVTASAVWNETFQFKVSERVRSHLKIHIQLLKYNYVEQDSSLGFAHLVPDPALDESGAKQIWLTYQSAQVFVESFVLTPETTQSIPTPKVEQGLRYALSDDLSLEQVLDNNELFMEFYDFLRDIKAPPYLQFFMNYEAYKQFTSMELGTDPHIAKAIDNYFKSGCLNSSQLEQLRMIKHDATDLFNNHFLPGSKFCIDVKEPILSELENELHLSDHVDVSNRFAGKSIGPNLFIPVYNWIYSTLRDIYFEKFRSSSRCHEAQAFSACNNFTLDDDEKFSQMSNESSLALQPEIPTDSEEMDMKKLSTAISLLKQQLALIEDKMEKTRVGSSEFDSLKKTRRNLEKQVITMKNLVRAKEMGAEGFGIDMADASIKIYLQSPDNISSSSLWSSDMLFDMELIKHVGEVEYVTLSIVSKSFSDFESFHRKIKKEFPKLDKIPFPHLGDQNIVDALQTYMLLLISDEFICQSVLLQEFVSIDTDLESKGVGQMVESIVGKKMKNVLQSATSILSGGMLGPSSGSPFKKKPQFYETREHHTISDLSSSPPLTATLQKSRSTTFLPCPEKDTSPTLGPKTSPPTPMKNRVKFDISTEASPSIFKIDEFSEAEIDMLMETVYSFVTETFDLREPNQWIRRKVLSVSKQLVKQAYGDTLSKTLTTLINDSLTEDALLKLIEEVDKLLWPNGIFIKDVPPPVRSSDQQLATQIEARALFLNKVPDVIEKLAGRYNAVNGMTRIFNLLQHKDFNKILFITVIDILAKVVFSDAVRPIS